MATGTVTARIQERKVVDFLAEDERLWEVAEDIASGDFVAPFCEVVEQDPITGLFVHAHACNCC